jgi:RNA polymerase sigma-70 factor (ECF subfamily)
MLASTQVEPHTNLVLRAGVGDRSAATALCQRFVPAVRAFARRRLVMTEAVDEFTQDVLLLLVEALVSNKVEQPERLPGFVLGICRNLARDRARQRERRAALLAEYAADVAAILPEPREEVTYELMHLEDCLSQLSGRSRELVRLAYAESKGHEDIARQLSVSEGNARVLRHRTLQALKECMSQRMSWECL